MANRFETRSITLTTGDGLRLEAERAVPTGPARGRAVVCHPHPLYGGNLLNPVVSVLARTLHRVGFDVIRFNFRGVGGSEGSHGAGVAEVADVVAALDGFDADEVDPTGGAGGLGDDGGGGMVLAGYSFGAEVALCVDDPRITAWVAVAPPLALVEASLVKAATDPRPKLLLAGTADQYRPADGLASATAAWPQTTVVALEGEDHFLATGSAAIGGAVERFLGDGTPSD